MVVLGAFLFFFGFYGFSLFSRLELLFLGLTASSGGGGAIGQGVASAVIECAGVLGRGVRGRGVISRGFVLTVVGRRGCSGLTIADVRVILVDGGRLIVPLAWRLLDL